LYPTGREETRTFRLFLGFKKGDWLRAGYAQFSWEDPHDGEVPVPFFEPAQKKRLGRELRRRPVVSPPEHKELLTT